MPDEVGYANSLRGRPRHLVVLFLASASVAILGSLLAVGLEIVLVPSPVLLGAVVLVGFAAAFLFLAVRFPRGIGWRTVEVQRVRRVRYTSGEDVFNRRLFGSGTVRSLRIEHAAARDVRRTTLLVVDERIYEALRGALPAADWVLEEDLPAGGRENREGEESL